MESFIALLRGINVGGHNVKMQRLRELFEEVGVTNVRSYINSGNIFFDSKISGREKLTKDIEKHLRESLGFEVPVFLRTKAEIDSILRQNPFEGIDLTSDKRFCVAFTKEAIKSDLKLPLSTTKHDMDIIAVNRREAFIVWHIINGRPPSGKFPSDVLPPVNTIRFYHTLNKIFGAANK